MRGGRGTLKCLGCNREFSVQPSADGVLSAKCPKCGLTHAGTAKTWQEMDITGIQVRAPKKVNSRITIHLN